MKCKNCNSTNGYIRIQTNEFVCRKCGFITKIEVKRDKKQITTKGGR